MRRVKSALGAFVVLARTRRRILGNGAEAANSTTCTGVLAPGSYGRVVVPAGASCFSDGGVTVRGGLYVQPGATFVLGSEDAPGDNGTISGGVHATNPANLQIHFMTINGGIESQGGSGPFGGPSTSPGRRSRTARSTAASASPAMTGSGWASSATT